MKIKLDENLSRRLKDPLSELGHDVSTAEDEGLSGRPDPEIALTLVVDTNRIRVRRPQ